MGGDLRQPSERGVLQKAMSAVVVGRGMMFKMENTKNIQRLRVSPAEVMEGKGKIHVIQDLTFDGSRSGAGREPKMSVYADTDAGKVPGCERGGILDKRLKRILGLGARFGS